MSTNGRMASSRLQAPRLRREEGLEVHRMTGSVGDRVKEGQLSSGLLRFLQPRASRASRRPARRTARKAPARRSRQAPARKTPRRPARKAARRLAKARTHAPRRKRAAKAKRRHR